MSSFGSKVLATAPPVPSKSHLDSAKTNLIWIDLETTGLDHNSDHIIKVGCLITNRNLDVIGEYIDFIIHLPDEILNEMNAWCKEHHGQSGLVDKCRASSMSLQEAEESLLTFLEKYTQKGACPSAGNSMFMVRLFLMKYMPKVYNHMHHHVVIDVSTVKELCRWWCPATFAKAPPKKHNSLNGLGDIVSELRFYKKYIYK